MSAFSCPSVARFSACGIPMVLISIKTFSLKANPFSFFVSIRWTNPIFRSFWKIVIQISCGCCGGTIFIPATGGVCV